MRERTPWSTAALPAAFIGLVLSGAIHAGAAASTQDAPSAAEQLAKLRDDGMVVYGRECAPCHGADGQGDGAGPPLNGATALANKEHVIKRILAGTSDGGMDPFAKVLTDRQVAAVATFVRTSWESTHGVVLEADVKPVRDQLDKDKKK